MKGPGKYDDICTQAREAAQADGAMLLVIHGKYGMGFSVQLSHPIWHEHLPTMLRDVADQIERDWIQIHGQTQS